jgi:hypothetical protein
VSNTEFNHDKPSHEHDSDFDAGPDEGTMPLGIGGMDEDSSGDGVDAFSDIDGEGKRGVNSGALLLIAVVAVAVVGLFSMRTLTRATAANEQPSDNEQSIESFLSMLQSSKSGDGGGGALKLGADGTRVLDVLNESYASRQVALTDVQRNPFIIWEVTASPEAPRQVGPDPIIQKRLERRTQFEQAARRVELRSVLMGNPPLATINTNIVQVGGTVTVEPEKIVFHVLSISNDGVMIAAEDEELGVRYETTLQIDHERSTRPSQRSTQRGPVRPR